MSDETKTDRTTEHEYDGIREYDNPLPGWWVALFWATLVFTPAYVVWYHFGAGPSVIEEYNADSIAHYDRLSREMLAAGAPTDGGILEMAANQAVMAGAAQVFASRCAQCHGAGAEGKIGPNLTDPYWLHGGRPTQIYHTITEGVPEKGMLAWKQQLRPAELLAVAAYVTSLQGSNPANPKPPQGDKHADEPPAGAGAGTAEPAALPARS
jgi:cytochrome c oxidase cbb3-type subunit 3